jgi:hypothetical protein
MTIPYATATSGDKALMELQRILGKFGCQSFGTMTDAEKGETIVQFRWRNRDVSLRASWKGYAAAWLNMPGAKFAVVLVGGCGAINISNRIKSHKTFNIPNQMRPISIGHNMTDTPNEQK